MLTVNTYISKSDIHGIGVFASDDIKTGTIVWKQGFERIFTEQEFELLPNNIQHIILIRGWKDIIDGLYRLSIDNDQFINHSDSANTTSLPDGILVAVCDIAAGQEITNNYYEFDTEVSKKF